MISTFTRRVSNLGSFTKDLVMAAAGCFLFMPAFCMVTADSDGSASLSSGRSAHAFAEPATEVGAALFLLSFIASEAIATIRVLGH